MRRVGSGKYAAHLFINLPRFACLLARSASPIMIPGDLLVLIGKYKGTSDQNFDKLRVPEKTLRTGAGAISP